MGTLFLIATPIGNLEDISLRAIRVLGEVDLIAAEDTRRAKILLGRYGIKTPVISYHEQGGKGRTAALLDRLRSADVALITEAGMPSISDPGYGIVAAAIEAGLPVDALPGASAVDTALAISGLPSHQFTFAGFPPRKAGERRAVPPKPEPGASDAHPLRGAAPAAGYAAGGCRGLWPAPRRRLPGADQAPSGGLSRDHRRGGRPLRGASRRVHPRHRRRAGRGGPRRRRYRGGPSTAGVVGRGGCYREGRHRPSR